MFKRNPFRHTKPKNGFKDVPAEKETFPLPDYLTDPNAVLGDKINSWRYGKAPDYSNTRKVQADTRLMNHEADSLAALVENLVKNWEIEASFKRDLNDCRTMDNTCYTFSVNGGPPQSAEHMSKVGTYNAVIVPNEYYSPEHSDFNSSHKTFKRMMPTFAWEVLEVYTGPPTLAFKWRHWGEMRNDYVGFNNAGEKVTALAHGGKIDFTGLTICRLTPEHKISALEVWYDPLEMFRQICRDTVVTKQVVGRLGKYALREGEDHATHLHGMDEAPKSGINPLSLEDLSIAMGGCPMGPNARKPTRKESLGVLETNGSGKPPQLPHMQDIYVPSEYGDPWGGKAPFENI